MAERLFEFDLYRLIVLDQEDVFEFVGKKADKDGDYLAIIKHACFSQFDFTTEGQKNEYRWSLRDFLMHGNDPEWRHGAVVSIRLARSMVEQTTQIVTDETIVEGKSHAVPPPAVPIRIVFYMERHLVAVERNSILMATQGWHDALHAMLDASAIHAGYRSSLRLEPVPEANQVIEAFMSFQRLTRIRVTLRLPNPEITRSAKQLYEQMLNGGIREYLNDMSSPNGLSQQEGGLPHAVASLAQEGYKKGEVMLAGIRDGKRKRVRTGRHAARGQLEQVRDFVRGAMTIARTRETQSALSAVINEIDRIHPGESLGKDPE
jgi:hypothetical protein